MTGRRCQRKVGLTKVELTKVELIKVELIKVELIKVELTKVGLNRVGLTSEGQLPDTAGTAKLAARGWRGKWGRHPVVNEEDRFLAGTAASVPLFVPT